MNLDAILRARLDLENISQTGMLALELQIASDEISKEFSKPKNGIRCRIQYVTFVADEWQRIFSPEPRSYPNGAQCADFPLVYWLTSLLFRLLGLKLR